MRIGEGEREIRVSRRGMGERQRGEGKIWRGKGKQGG